MRKALIGAASVLTVGLERICCICGEELFDRERDYCEDCRHGGDLEDVLEAAMVGNANDR